MRRTWLLLLTMLLVLGLAGCGGKQETAGETETKTETQTQKKDAVTYDLAEAGVSFELPEVMAECKGVIDPMYGTELEAGCGIWLSALMYGAATQEKYMELVAKGSNLSEEEIAFVQDRFFEFLIVYTVDGDRGAAEAEKELTTYGLPTEGLREIGTAGEYHFYAVVNPLKETVEKDIVFDEGFREDFDAVLAACEDLSWVRVYEPEKKESEVSGHVISFETTDLDGNAVRSEELFAGHKLTMINIWGTYCGPCIREMPDLEELNKRLQEKGCAIVGVVCDVSSAEDEAQVKAAKDIIADTGVTYPNLVLWERFSVDLPAEFVPTSYLVDENGLVVGSAAIGARGADDYEAWIDEALAEPGK